MVVPSATYDIVFAGGGASACVTAGRLAMANPSLKILILETGPQTQDIPKHVQPARYFNNLVLPSETFTRHISKPSQSLAGRSIVVPSGRCLGGGSSVNFTVYTRAAASDYDDWESVYKNPGWGSKDLIPLLKKAETYQPGAEGNPSTHGTSGPIKVSLPKEQINIGSQFLAVAAKYDKERGFTDDVNNFSSCNAYGRWPRYVDESNGRRSDVPHHYIYGQAGNQNLKILVRQRVVRVIIENDRAVGVEHVDDTAGHSNRIQEPSISYASKLVVVSAGAFGTPAILERSGIGGADILKKNNITQVVDLPGVGEHYMDHSVMFPPYFASEDADTLDVIFRGTEVEIEPYASQWLRDGTGLMSHSGQDAGIKIRPNAEDLKEIGPEFQMRWQSYFANAPDKPVMFIGAFAAYAGVNPTAPRRKYFSMPYFTEYPVSVGRVHIQSGLDPYEPLNFEIGYLDDPADLGVLRWAYKKAREFARRMDSYRGEFDLEHPQFPQGSQAACDGSAQPVAISFPDIVYSDEDNKAIDAFHRQKLETSWHSMGTCAMKPKENGGVVDARLNVYGIQNLKITDCSIAPSNVCANTYNTAIAIGEKAAVIITADLDLKGC